MHGRPRKPLKPEDEAASLAKAAKLRTLQNQLLHIHHNRIYDKEALEISSKLLEINPEIYTAWNYRRLAVENNLRSEIDPDSIKALLDEELRVVESALRRNFKSYGAWHHRKWVLSKGFSSIEKEFKLLDQFLKADSRNFHGWNYRRFVAALKNVSEEEELKFTTDKINANFSNYSAWHNRSVLLSHLLKKKAQGFVPREKVLTDEYELIHQALFTDPDDQSGWFYHLWLLDQTVNQDAPLLISSWPIDGSELILSTNGNMDAHVTAPFTSSLSEYVLPTGCIPLILYFNHAVEGVSSSTVIVESMFDKNEDLIWRPLSINNSGRAHAWVTYLKLPDVNHHALKAYPVEVSLGHSQGIISSNGSNYNYSSRFGFNLNLQSTDPDQAERKSVTEMVIWKDNFYTDETLLLDLSPTALSLDQLRISEDHEPSVSKWHIDTLANEIALFRELLSEINCKIAKLTLARLLMARDALMSLGTLCMQKRIHSEEVLQLFNDLMKLDPVHACYYKDEHSLVLMEQLTSNRESLVKHCSYYKELKPSRAQPTVCLRLNKLSLSRIGFFERLLWVQMLDLSHNELQSIEGLEVMQLLTSLNLSNNRFRSFTALEPLKLIKPLKTLDISHNEIGAHPIDTTRYLCSSPLSQAIGIDWNAGEYTSSNVNTGSHWEAILIFKDLHLAQLDVEGNAVCDEDFRVLLVRVIPTLEWLNGKHI
ncbi:geranylgeranyl transferase type-2 subunit alpha 1 [Magnolia sinica]|uniref:geranylgeranyl transferase type-2 subunit alpha 1 n=1 Tax=Magnolia sinica TaxID=86752 RepID=UPI00265AE269|nr:geranylgeranyl transferase type-2 subunit alpha 1 [Magnolia sinica]